MARGWQQHPVFGREPFSRRDAWIWLIEHAAFTPRRVDVFGRIVEVQRGQLCRSLRDIAKEWGWDEAKVRRFLSRLQKENMIRCDTDARRTIITICNYEQYQNAGCVGDAEPDAEATHHRRITDAQNKERKEGKEGNLESIGQAPARDDGEFEQWWEHVPRKVAKGQARKAFRAARKKADFATLLTGIQRYAASVSGQDPKFIAHPATWLNGERWIDDHLPRDGPDWPKTPQQIRDEVLAEFGHMRDW